jgi:hypothetical protein
MQSSDCLQLTRKQNSYSSTPPPAGWSGLRAWYPLTFRPYDLPASLFDRAIVRSASGCIVVSPRSLWPPPPPPRTCESIVLVVLRLLSGERAYYNSACSRTSGRRRQSHRGPTTTCFSRYSSLVAGVPTAVTTVVPIPAARVDCLAASEWRRLERGR